MVFARTVDVGTPVELRHNPANPVDTDAVEVWIDGQHVGWVPNSGTTCPQCWTYVNQGSWDCPVCGATELIKGGLASRLVRTGAINQRHGAVVKKVDQTAERVALHVLFLLE